MGRKSKYVKKLIEEQKSSLQKGYSHGKSPLFRRKCHCILLNDMGKDATELSSLFQVGRQTILNKKENAEHVEIVKTLIENEPKNLLRVTAQLEAELNIQVSKRTLKRFLKNLNTNGNVFENA